MGKAAIERLTQLLAVELGRHGIRVNSVGPTYVMTPPLKAKIEAGQRDMKKIMSVPPLPPAPARPDPGETPIPSHSYARTKPSPSPASCCRSMPAGWPG